MLNVLAISSLFPSPADPLHGGFVYNRLRAMQSLDSVNVCVINPVPTSPIHRYLPRYRNYQSTPEHWVKDGLPVHSPRYFALPGVKKEMEMNSLRRKLMQSVKNYDMQQFDVIDVHWTYPDLPAAIAIGQHYNIPVAVTLRGMEAFYRDSCPIRESEIIYALTQADLIVSLSQEMADHAELVASAGEKTVIITNGGNPEIFYPIPQRQAQHVLSLDSDAFHVLGVGSLIKRKGFHRVIEALSVIARNLTRPVVYHLVGGSNLEGHDGAFLASLAKQCEHSMFRVNFAGKANPETLRNWYNAADLFVLSSLGEGSPNVLTEALCCGTPSLSVDVGATRTILSQHPVAYNLIADNNDAALMARLKTYLTTPDIHPADSERRKNGYSQHAFDWTWCATRHAESLRTVVSQRSPSPAITSVCEVFG